MDDLVSRLNEPDVHYPANFDTPKRANAILSALCQEAADEIERLKAERDVWQQVIVAAVELVCAPAWAGVSDEDVMLEKALRDAGLVTPNAEIRGGEAVPLD